MFTKASKRVCLALVAGKMAEKTKLVRRRELRAQQKFNIRKAMLISDYIQTKYSDIYCEANEFFTRINKRNSDKRDLTKAIEYKAWKMTALSTKPVDPKGAKTQKRKPVDPKGAKTQKPLNEFQLRIPLIDYGAVTEETLDTVTEETLDQGTVDPVPRTETFPDLIAETVEIVPSILEEMTPDLMAQLIEELKVDVDLNNFFQDLESELDIELIQQ